VLDELVVTGSPAQCRQHLQSYLDAGLDGIAVHVLTAGVESLAVLERLGRVS
jgi:alkanesulfonate monooxygenase SsuD/methylene tetrahydromethanopterin reductase-like flavin-dependent oxidoreductase (luciferase family)